MFPLVVSVIASLAFHAEPLPAATRSVTICLDGNLESWVRARAVATASEIYSSIGVATVWRTNSKSCPAAAIRVKLSDDRRDSYHEESLATSYPYEGIHVEVYVNRVRDTAEPTMFPPLLAHVLVHETAHILQGVARHSPTGLMKAKFTREDCRQMYQHPLAFTKEDTRLIYEGIDKRAQRLSAAVNPDIVPWKLDRGK